MAFSKFNEWGPLSSSLQASHCSGFSSEHGLWSMQAPVAAARAQWLWLAALQHVGSSQTRGQTCVPCIGRQILNLWATREVLIHALEGFLFCLDTHGLDTPFPEATWGTPSSPTCSVQCWLCVTHEFAETAQQSDADVWETDWVALLGQQKNLGHRMWKKVTSPSSVLVLRVWHSTHSTYEFPVGSIRIHHLD